MKISIIFLMDVEFESHEISNSRNKSKLQAYLTIYCSPAIGHKKQKQFIYNIIGLNQSQTINKQIYMSFKASWVKNQIIMF